MAEKQLGELDDVDEAVEDVVKAAEGRTAVTSLLNQIKEMVDADAFTCLAQDTELLGDEQAAGSVISVIQKAFDKIDGTLDLDDVKYISRQAKKHGDEEDILNYVLRRHGVKVPGSGSKIGKLTIIDGGTSDLLVNGINYDVYTPITNNPSAIISAIAKKILRLREEY